MGTIYSFQLGGMQSNDFAGGVPVNFFVAELPYTWVVRDIEGRFIFGGSGDELEVGFSLGGSGLLTPLIRWSGDSSAPEQWAGRVVMDPGDVLYWMATVSGAGPQGGFVVSGYRLTPP